MLLLADTLDDPGVKQTVGFLIFTCDVYYVMIFYLHVVLFYPSSLVISVLDVI